MGNWTSGFLERRPFSSTSCWFLIVFDTFVTLLFYFWEEVVHISLTSDLWPVPHGKPCQELALCWNSFQDHEGHKLQRETILCDVYIVSKNISKTKEVPIFKNHSPIIDLAPEEYVCYSIPLSYSVITPLSICFPHIILFRVSFNFIIFPIFYHQFCFLEKLKCFAPNPPSNNYIYIIVFLLF